MCPMLTARFTPSASNRVSTGKGISRDGCAGSIETPNPGGITNSACRSVGPRPAQPSSLTDPTGFTKSKYDGYRLRVERDGDRVRLITRGGYNWTDRFPWIVEAAASARQTIPPDVGCWARRRPLQTLLLFQLIEVKLTRCAQNELFRIRPRLRHGRATLL